MAKCPKCKADIDHLTVERDEVAILTFRVGEDGQPEYTYERGEESSGQEDFRCPACGEFMGFGEDGATELLRR